MPFSHYIIGELNGPRFCLGWQVDACETREGENRKERGLEKEGKEASPRGGKVLGGNEKTREKSGGNFHSQMGE